LQGRDLQYKLVIIQGLVFVLPFCLLTYMLYIKEAFRDVEHVLAYLLLLFVVLAGIITLRQIFDRILRIAAQAQRAAAGDIASFPVENLADTEDLKEISASFKILLDKFQEVGKELTKKTNDLLAIKEISDIANEYLHLDRILQSLCEKSLYTTNAAVATIYYIENDHPLKVIPSPNADKTDDFVKYSYEMECRARLTFLDMKPTIPPSQPGNISTISMPVIDREDLKAVIIILRKETQPPFQEDDLQSLAVMFNTVNSALQNAVLHRRIEEQYLIIKEKSESLQREIEERKAMEASLRQTEENWRRYAFIVNTAKEFMTLINRDYRYETVSHSYCLAHNKVPEDLVGKTVGEIWGTEGEEIIKKHLDRCFSGQEVYYQEIFEFDKGGKRHYDVSYYPYRSGTGGDVSHAVVVTHDVHDHVLNKLALEKTVKKLRSLTEGIIAALSKVIEIKDPYTAGHQHSVAGIALAIAEALHLSEEQRELVRISAEIHDIGKICIPSEILSKPSKLSDMEFTLIKSHPEMANVILGNIDFPIPIAPIILQHHERLDGSGYPLGLKEQQICLEARIIAVADVVDSMSSHRPYRPALGIEMAMDELIKNKGILYDRDVVDAFLAWQRRSGAHKQDKITCDETIS